MAVARRVLLCCVLFTPCRSRTFRGTPEGAGQLDAAHPEPTELQLYGRLGSDVLIPGLETELQGEGVLEWYVKKAGDQERQWILAHHYGSNEAEMHAKYKDRVLLSFNNASLRLFNLTHHDDGLYILQLMLVDKKQVPLTVLEPISDIIVMKILSSGDSGVRLMCEASGDVWNLTWWNNGRELMQDITREGNTSELVIKEVGTGSYICVTWNPISQLEKSYQIAPEGTVILYVVGFLMAAAVFGLPFALSQLVLFVCRVCSCQQIGQRVNVFQRSATVCWFLFLIGALVSTIVGKAFLVPYAVPGLNVVLLVALVICLFIEMTLLLVQRLKQPSRSKAEDSPGNQGATLDNRNFPDAETGVQDIEVVCQKELQGVPLTKEESPEDSPVQSTAERICCALNTFQPLLGLAVIGGSWFTLLSCFIVGLRAYEKPAHFDLAISLAALVPVVVIMAIYCCCRPNGPLRRWLDGPDEKPVTKELTQETELEFLPKKVPDGRATYSLVSMSGDSDGRLDDPMVS